MAEKGQIAVIGAGLMGHGIGQVFAVHGHRVFLLDVNKEVLAEAVEKVRSNLTALARSGIGRYALQILYTDYSMKTVSIDLNESRYAGASVCSLRKVRVTSSFLQKRRRAGFGVCPRCRESYPLADGALCLGCQGEAPYITDI